MPIPVPRRLLPLALLPIVLFPIALVPLWSRRAGAEPTFTLDTLMARLAAAGDRRATFREEKRLAALETPLLSTGTLALRAGHVEKNTVWPIPEKLEIDADRIAITAGSEPPRVISLSMAPELRVLIDGVRGPLLGDAAAVTRAFEARLAGTWSAWTLVLVPRDPAGRAMVGRIQVEGREAEITTLTTLGANGDEQVMRITPR